MTPNQIFFGLIFSIIRLTIVLTSIASVFYLFAIGTGMIFTGGVPQIFLDAAPFFIAGALLNTILMLVDPKTRQRAGPMSLVAPALPFEKDHRLLTLASKGHTILYWAWVLLFAWKGLDAMPNIAIIAFLILTPFAWQYAMTGAKAMREA